VGGPAIINVDGTSRHGSHDQVNVSVTVIAPLTEEDADYTDGGEGE